MAGVRTDTFGKLDRMHDHPTVSWERPNFLADHSMVVVGYSGCIIHFMRIFHLSFLLGCLGALTVKYCTAYGKEKISKILQEMVNSP